MTPTGWGGGWGGVWDAVTHTGCGVDGVGV